MPIISGILLFYSDSFYIVFLNFYKTEPLIFPMTFVNFALRIKYIPSLTHQTIYGKNDVGLSHK